MGLEAIRRRVQFRNEKTPKGTSLSNKMKNLMKREDRKRQTNLRLNRMMITKDERSGVKLEQ